MCPRLFHIYGPLWINSYGLMIAIGFLLFSYLTYRHPLRRNVVSGDVYINTILIGLISGIVGGRILFVLVEWDAFTANLWEVLYPWIGGFSVLGAILGILIGVPLYLKKHQVQILPVFDIIALYAPLLQSIARIGCFLAGCCYGVRAPKNFPFAVTFTHPESLAPTYIPLHPTQLYYSALSLLLFAMLLVISRRCFKVPGVLLCLYLIGESIIRFSSDFLRGDWERVYHAGLGPLTGIFSAYQLVSMVMFSGAIIGLFMLLRRK